MIAIHPEYVVDKRNHPKAVLVPMKDWRKIVEELEELDDIRAYDAAKASNATPLPCVGCAARANGSILDLGP